ncbi:HIG1 domain family member 1A, mitochondrial-like [Haliotis cracherodii]|uniref:HIG1 domain family member 1A, mitochondrial-like n=1 Tax=Haliotis rufescens TaxID=6454 RepID=UPI00201EDF99|nr:HIG1 domain family member 1A, mitochondrial-like [Haliotis rufescens]
MPDMSSETKRVDPPQWEDSVSAESKLWRKAKEAPFVPIGILGLLGAVTYGAVMYKRRGQMSTSVYLMQFRVISQGMVVGAITLGIGATVVPGLWKKYVTGSTSGGKS